MILGAIGFFEIFAYILAFFYAIVPNLGISIILLTVTVMLLMFPLTAKQAKSMVEMQRLQPEIKKLQAKYKGDRQKLNEEMMKLYQEHKVNPLGGCLPLLVQMPVFFGLFQVLRNAYEYVPEGSQLYNAFCGTQTRTECEMNGANHLEFLGMDLAQSARDVGGGFLNALPYFILVGLVVLTGYFQSRQSQRNNPNAEGPAVMIQKVLPIAFGVFSIGFPSGLVLYFLTSNLWRLGQQELIMRKIAPRPHMTGGTAGTKAVPKKADDAKDVDVIDTTEAEADATSGNGAKDGGNGAKDTGDGGNGAKGGGFLSRLMPASAPTPEEKPPPTAAPSSGSAASRAAASRSRAAKRKKRKRR